EVSAQQRIAAQMSQQKKIAQADYVINNSGTVAETLKQVDVLWSQLVGR
ncbi:MAG: dephospho-CoA kinase, partial [Desulfuromusa sp.]|nr:dephospho-CoA kinase [Desulfuromusa sp.]